jgi:membrane protease YdiL (CAAX protease family)
LSLDASVPALVYGVGLAGPTLAALAVEQRHRGWSGVLDLLGSGRPRTIRRSRAAAALVAQPLMMVGAARIAKRRVRVRPVEPTLAWGQFWVVAAEEFGWRGFVWPRLERQFGPVKATLALAGMWGLWHLPMFFVPASLQSEDNVLRFGAAITAWSFVHSLLQLDSPSVGTAMLFHGVTNLSLNALDIDLEASSGGLTVMYASVAAAAAAMLALHRRRDRRPRHATRV